MKNIHVLPTQNEITSKLFKVSNELKLTRKYDFYNGAKYQNIYITSNEEIKEGDWFILNFGLEKPELLIATKENIVAIKDNCHKIILTTDPLLDDVQAIDDEFLEWFVKNPSFEFVEVKKGFADGSAYGYDFLSYRIIFPKEESKQENCCTPAGQIKRYVDCIGCDRKPKQMSKQTAVEWVIEQYINKNRGLEVFMKAIQMEKEQITEAFKEGNLYHGWALKHEPEQYYNKTYKKEK